MIYHNKKSAFTLAEVLITLGIIGIVAALTIPSMVENHQKKVLANKLEKAYSELSNVIRYAEAEHGDTKSWNYYDDGELNHWVETYILPYVKYSFAGDCAASGCNDKGISGISQLGKKYNGWTPSSGYLVKLSGGNSIAYLFHRYSGASYPTETRVYVYINNPKKTSAMVGKDAFRFYLKSTDKNPSFKPFGYDQTRDTLLNTQGWGGHCRVDAGGSGYWTPGDACAAVIMQDGWEIKDDYPWY